MLYQPTGQGLFHRACEADSYTALVAALLDDPGYEASSLDNRLQQRVRMADDLVLLGQLQGRKLHMSDRDERDSINVHTDEEFVRSLEQQNYLSLSREA
jgi:hypothetical protein